MIRVGSVMLEASARSSSRPNRPIPYAAAEPRNNNPGRPDGAYNDDPTPKMIADQAASKSCVWIAALPFAAVIRQPQPEGPLRFSSGAAPVDQATDTRHSHPDQHDDGRTVPESPELQTHEVQHRPRDRKAEHQAAVEPGTGVLHAHGAGSVGKKCRMTDEVPEAGTNQGGYQEDSERIPRSATLGDRPGTAAAVPGDAPLYPVGRGDGSNRRYA